ncbi:acyltransferase family protein [Actinokineospora iranica]|uniref:acyltransferase family protein n=1 Tax=Actinokineospora iranica TaxID=1271860 RepID=UPI001E5AA1BD|nr:acyltransferase family protein [Actinokineospora iranica]
MASGERLATGVVGPEDEARPRRYRPEIQGLRALALTLVVVYHVWLGRVSGGVDVFFVVAGFLLTGQLTRAVEGRGIDFRPLWGRMITRLFPAALTVLFAVMVATVVWLPQNRWLQTIREIGAAALYVENWQLATDSIDYYAQNNVASVVQRFWSLSIQGQLYLAWPLLFGALAFLVHRAGRRLRPALLAVLLAVLTASLAYSVWLTAVNQPLAYFHTLTRVWEFALGGVLALVPVSLPRRVRVALGWAGVVALVLCGLVIPVGGSFPGYLALWPTLSAVAVILAGNTGDRMGVDRFLVSRPLRYLGDLSYSLYLWHWPVLVFFLVVHDRATVGPRAGAVIIVVSLALAALTHHLIEEPVRRSRLGVARWAPYRLAALTLASVLLVLFSWHTLVLRANDFSGIAQGDPDHPGALARAPGFEYSGIPDASLLPPMVALSNDWAGIDERDCALAPGTRALRVCTSETRTTPAKRIAVVGDSHIGQYVAALAPIAERHDWQLVIITRGGCPYSTASELAPGDLDCLEWNDDATAEILRLRPDAVFTLATRDVRVGRTEWTPPGFVERWRELDRAGITVLAVRDNPRFGHSPPECVLRDGAESDRCAVPRGDILAADPPYDNIPDIPSNVSFLDFSDYFCTSLTCPPTIGNVLVYMDDNHVTATFMTTLAPVVEDAILDATGW